MKKKVYEIDLYEPVQHYFSSNGYVVQGEVNDCDIVAIKEKQLVIIELKLSLSLSLILQAVKRQRLTKFVYVAIPHSIYRPRTQKWRDQIYLLRRLELGLITVSFQSEEKQINIIFEPKKFDRIKSMAHSKKRKNKLLAEVANRSGHYNVGGSSQTKIITAYMESCIHIACCLNHYGLMSPKKLREKGTGDKTGVILQKNYYGWFKRVERGIYTVSSKGLLALDEYPDITHFYNSLIAEDS